MLGEKSIENKSLFLQALIEGNHTAYFKEALKENTWGGYLEILAVTALYDINVIIVLGKCRVIPRA